MTDDLTPRLDAIESALSRDVLGEALAAFDQRIAASAPAVAAAPSPAPAPAASWPVDPVALAIEKLHGYSPAERDPEPIELDLMSYGEQQAVSDLRSVLSDPSKSMFDRAEVQRHFDQVWAHGADARAERVRSHAASIAAQKRAAEAARTELIAENAELARREVKMLAGDALNLAGGEMFQRAVESGAMELDDASLRSLGWGTGPLMKLAAMRQRVVQVGGGGADRDGFMTFTNERGTFAYCPQGEDVASFVAKYGG